MNDTARASAWGSFFGGAKMARPTKKQKIEAILLALSILPGPGRSRVGLR